MGALEVILILIGIFIILISCVVVGKEQDRSKNVQRIIPKPQDLTEEEKEKLNHELSVLLEGIKEETIEETEEYLSTLSNEKIMSVTDLSDQVLEKIKNNHEEVIFLYNMLNDKEEELKTLAGRSHMPKELVSNEEKVDLPIKSVENNNKQILSLHSKGKSIDEIARMLGIGHGEVKLVIDLFKAK